MSHDETAGALPGASSDPPSPGVSRRRFLAGGAAAAAIGGPAAAATAATAAARATRTRVRTGRRRDAVRPVVISSGNGMRTVERAWDLMMEGESPTVAVVEGVKIVEADPTDRSVGLGGLPNAEGVVQLDASVMDGRMHKAGAVGGVENILHVSEVALRVLDSTDHVMLVGDGAYRFARQMGHPHAELLTEQSAKSWRAWKRKQNADDDWLDQRIPLRENAGGDPAPGAAPGAVGPGEQMTRRDLGADAESDAESQLGYPFTWGTIHCSAIAPDGDVGSCTTTSGLSWKIPGRVGDSPIIGAGCYCDNAVGGAGATGRGESLIQSCGSYEIVRGMEEGMAPVDACLAALRRIARNTRRPELLNNRGEPNFNAIVYAVNRAGVAGSAVMRSRSWTKYAVCDENGPRREQCAGLFED
ncbi:MAG: N(4)-(beta-N-acetylglucosaminyl)-L-asparaginase [Phycisphaerales bacterium]